MSHPVEKQSFLSLRPGPTNARLRIGVSLAGKSILYIGQNSFITCASTSADAHTMIT
jgi:hypothetical protein